MAIAEHKNQIHHHWSQPTDSSVEPLFKVHVIDGFVCAAVMGHSRHRDLQRHLMSAIPRIPPLLTQCLDQRSQQCSALLLLRVTHTTTTSIIKTQAQT
jgi:hypothetical protein